MKKLLETLSEIVELYFYTFILKQRNRLIDRSIKRISKYKRKLEVEEKYLSWLKEDTKELIDKGTYM